MTPRAREGNWKAAFHSKFYSEWADRTDRRESGASHSAAVVIISRAETRARCTSELTIVALLFLT